MPEYIMLLFAISMALTIQRQELKSLDSNNIHDSSALPPSKITLLHTNDIHAHFSEFNEYGTDCNELQMRENICYGGAARLKTAIEAFRSNSSEVVLLDAGDQFQGTLFFNVYGGNVSAMIMNELKYDAMTVGNHEFDRGVDELASFVSLLNFPVVTSNINLDARNLVTKPLLDAGVKPFVILEKYKLGIVGFITNTTASIIANGDKLKCSILDPIVTVQNSIDILKGQGINRIIGLSHNGYEDDIYVAKNVKGLQLIVGGHSHSLLLDTNYSPLGNVAGRYPTTVISSLDKKSTYIVQAHRFGDYLGHVDLEWDNNDELVKISGKPILLDQTIIKDENMDTLVKEYAKSFHTITNDVVTSSTGNFPPCSDSKQCSMGKLITNCMLSEQRTRPIKPEIALINTGGIRATFSTGPVTASAILAVLPFGNSVTNFYMSGKELSRVLARAAIATGPSKPISAPQWSGLDFKIEEGNLTNIKVNGIDLELSNSYALTSIDFLVDGGDNILEKITPTPVPEIVLADLVTTCLRKLKQISP